MRRSDVRFLSLAHVLAMHDEAIAVVDDVQGDPAIRDVGLVDSAVNAPRNAYVDTLAELAAIYAHALAKDHGFVDGNKRTAVYAMLAFLEVNGYAITLSSQHWEAIFEDLAAGNVSRERLAEEIAIELGRRRERSGPPDWILLTDDE